jgi:hydrogenase expression/formation protein HypE
MNNTILLGHGSGGLMTSALIRDLFVKYFSNDTLDALSDSAVLKINGNYLAFTTDSFVVDPIFFPGGDIGKLAVCGTVNDLSVSGAKPLFLSAGFILEEGFSLADLERITASMAKEAEIAGVRIVTGDTKVVKRGQCDKIFINTAGIGVIENKFAALAGGTMITQGDQILVNGYLGDHEMAILSARENLSFEEPVLSDVASLNRMIQSLLESGISIRFMRDITRGGLGTILAEIAASGKTGVEIHESSLPIREQVNGLCEIYGFNPLYLANEGKVLMIVSRESAGSAVELMKGFDTGKDACIIGSISNMHPGRVLMKSVIGGSRIIDKLTGEQLPRIC